ncbi:aminotransferase class V-fold PLP-dependent enzyme [Clostridium chromiireducens]|uniref:aminotransferase class V-fold PLP-dependent enzyme n=1 Tax=Clostridium chromiireducens TaxID=225345 RepID=UPI001FAAEF4D|nr:aminotransferase class V-fold PLP-dependent enzyme [Clostridium chromiireducens]
MGGTIALFQDFEEFINENTKTIFIETIGNPKLNVVDINAIARIAHSYNIPLIVDNTFATPFIIRPTELGADIVIHSSSKCINGSGISISGVIIDSGNFKWDFEHYPNLATSKKFGRFSYHSKLRGGLFKNLGSCLIPFNEFLNGLALEQFNGYFGAILTIRAMAKENTGVFDDLIRISVGLEDIEDLITDFENTISKI